MVSIEQNKTQNSSTILLQATQVTYAFFETVWSAIQHFISSYFPELLLLVYCFCCNSLL